MDLRICSAENMTGMGVELAAKHRQCEVDVRIASHRKNRLNLGTAVTPRLLHAVHGEPDQRDAKDGSQNHNHDEGGPLRSRNLEHEAEHFDGEEHATPDKECTGQAVKCGSRPKPPTRMFNLGNLVHLVINHQHCVSFARKGNAYCLDGILIFTACIAVQEGKAREQGRCGNDHGSETNILGHGTLGIDEENAIDPVSGALSLFLRREYQQRLTRPTQQPRTFISDRYGASNKH